LLQNISTIKQELKTIPHVLDVASTNSTPVNIAGGYTMRSDGMPENEQIGVAGNPIDESYVKTTGLEIIAGSDLTHQDMRDIASENHELRKYHFILNESAARVLGWTPENAIGKKLFMGHRSGSIKAVVRDFHFESMHNAIKPLVLFTELRGRHLLMKVDGFNLRETISRAEQKWKELVPNLPFEYKFLNDEYNGLYHSELQLGTIMKLFSTIAIVLACLGLFGLSSYIMQQRTKEIAIRKVLGASMFNIINLLSGRFAKLVVLSVLIASPAGYFFMNSWLQDFAYRIEINLWIFVFVGLLALAIALLTVSVQSFRAAVINPAESMKSE
jgi:putative ABC transport system permease protein